MLDELPKNSNPVECGIVELENTWICYIKNYNTRCYFDSFVRKTPLELGYYFKTAEEIENNSSVIMRNSYIVQKEGSKISGHLCLFVLTSTMREHDSFEQAINQLSGTVLHAYCVH